MPLLEIACFTPQSAITAAAGGADRIELCQDYAAGGLTPSLDAVAAVKARLSIPVYAMIRPHARSFCYDATDYAAMESTMDDLKRAGVDGFVFGILHDHPVAVDVERNRALVARAEGRPCTFHRAFDRIPEEDWDRAWTDIALCGFAAILTSGGPSGQDAVDCVTVLGERLVTGARRHGLDVVVGGGVRASNVASLWTKTQAPAFHSAALLPSEDEVREDEVRHLRAATAPGDGITVYGNGWSFSNANDAIVRYIRIRMGRGGDAGKDAVTVASGNRMIFDHLAVSWGRDETFSISGTGSNVAVRNSIVAQGLQTHSCGGLSLLRNLYIDNKTRNPKVKGVNEFTNNVVYNWGGGGGYIAGGSSNQSHVNIIGNYFISGPSTGVTAFTRGNENFHGYAKDNFYDPDKDGTLNGNLPGESTSNYGGMDLVPTNTTDCPAVATVLTPEDAVAYITKFGGASKVRDAVDTRLIEQLKSYGTQGSLISDEVTMGGAGEVDGGSSPKDSDGDGIPNEAEEALGTDPHAADSMQLHRSGYTNLEVWANSLVPSSYQ